MCIALLPKYVVLCVCMCFEATLLDKQGKCYYIPTPYFIGYKGKASGGWISQGSTGDI